MKIEQNGQEFSINFSDDRIHDVITLLGRAINTWSNCPQDLVDVYYELIDLRDTSKA